MKKYFFIFICLVSCALPVHADTIHIGASLPDLGSIASYIGGDKVDVFSIARNNNNPHFVEVLPSYMIKVSRCDIYLKVGLSLDQWADAIIDGSRNTMLTVVDCSMGVRVLQKPVGKIDASLGDVHPDGNPHYWLDPLNGIVIAGTVCTALKKIDPSNSVYYDTKYEKFKHETEQRIVAWNTAMEKIAGEKIITYHSSWVYFAAAFHLVIAGNIEPFPGIPPTGKHLAGLVDMIKREGISIVLQEPYFCDDASQFLARKTGIRVYKCAPSCSDVKPDSYFTHFDEIVGKLTR